MFFMIQYKNNPRFSFVKYENRGHDYVFYSDKSRDYQESLIEISLIMLIP